MKRRSGSVLSIAGMPSIDSITLEVTDLEDARRFYTAAFGLGQMIGPVVGGWLAERQGGFDGALLLAAGAVALGAVLIAAGRATSRA